MDAEEHAAKTIGTCGNAVPFRAEIE